MKRKTACKLTIVQEIELKTRGIIENSQMQNAKHMLKGNKLLFNTDSLIKVEVAPNVQSCK